MSFNAVKTFSEKTVPTGAAETLIAASASKKLDGGVMIQSLSTNTVNVYLGDSGVTSANGLEISPGTGIFIECDDASDIYCIAGTAGQKLRVLGVGVRA